MGKHIKKWSRRLLVTVSGLALASVFSMTGATEAKADCNDNSFPGFGNVVFPDEENCESNGGLLGDNGTNFLNAGAGFWNGSGNANAGALSGGFGPEINLQVGNLWVGAVNDSGNANILFGSGITANIAALNAGFGIANGSGSGNVLAGQLAKKRKCPDDLNFEQCEAESKSDFYRDSSKARKLAVGNASFGVLNRSLNGNVLGAGNSSVVELENFASGVGNLSGNANILGGATFSSGHSDDPQTVNAILEVKVLPTGDSSVFMANNQAFGNLNGAGNANSFGTPQPVIYTTDTEDKPTEPMLPEAELFMVDNTFFGNGNALGNGNGYSGYASISNNFMTGTGNGSLNGNGTVELFDGAPNGPAPTIVAEEGFAEVKNGENGNGRGGGNGSAELNDNFLSGDFNGSANGNGREGNAYIAANTAFGARNLSGNGNSILSAGGGLPNGDGGYDSEVELKINSPEEALKVAALTKDESVTVIEKPQPYPGRGGQGNALIERNSVTGAESGSGNGNAFIGNANAEIEGNNVNGEQSASGNANAMGFGDADADVKENTVLGGQSLSGNGNAVGGPVMVAAPLDETAEAESLPPRGPAANAWLKDNTVIGDGSASANANGGSTGDARLFHNTVLGDSSLSHNANQVFGDCGPDGKRLVDDKYVPCSGDGSAVLKNNTIIGDHSLSYNETPTDGTFNAANNTVVGSYSADFVGDNFNENTVIGNGSMNFAGQDVQNNTTIGDNSGNGLGDGSTGNLTVGDNSGNNVGSDDNIAMGNLTGNNVAGDRNIAIGTGTGNGIAASDTLAIGTGAWAGANNSSAIGAGAVASLPNQMVFGTASETYTAPGITSNLSKSRQSGSLEVVTSDANGNLATDGGQIYDTLDRNSAAIGQNSAAIGQNSAAIGQNSADISRNRTDIKRNRSGIEQNQEGIAVAMSAHGPDLVTNETFGISLQWGGFEGSSALGGGVTGVVYRDDKFRMALTGGLGVGLDEGSVGGRAGGQLTW